jgi:hypothetical protein
MCFCKLHLRIRTSQIVKLSAKEIARCLVPDIIAFFETEEAKREFEEWKIEQEKKNAIKTKNEAMPK